MSFGTGGDAKPTQSTRLQRLSDSAGAWSRITIRATVLSRALSLSQPERWNWPDTDAQLSSMGLVSQSTATSTKVGSAELAKAVRNASSRASRRSTEIALT